MDTFYGPAQFHRVVDRLWQDIAPHLARPDVRIIAGRYDDVGTGEDYVTITQDETTRERLDHLLDADATSEDFRLFQSNPPLERLLHSTNMLPDDESCLYDPFVDVVVINPLVAYWHLQNLLHYDTAKGERKENFADHIGDFEEELYKAIFFAQLGRTYRRVAERRTFCDSTPWYKLRRDGEYTRYTESEEVDEDRFDPTLLETYVMDIAYATFRGSQPPKCWNQRAQGLHRALLSCAQLQGTAKMIALAIEIDNEAYLERKEPFEVYETVVPSA